ncbi:MAG TPA: hypothetical protein PLH83_13980 [Ruminococcus sp.]|nr:hypothetical protein [Ruminococcus sp.]
MPPKYTHEEFLRVAKLNPSITLLGKYTSMQQKIKFQCNICGTVGYKVAHDLKRGIGCKYCAKTQTSFAECFIRVALEVAGVRVLARDKSAIDSELDIYLPDYRLAVEPGAWNFHRNRLTKDLEKWRKCCDNNIELQIIYDSFDPGDISMVEKYEFISTYEKCLSFGDGCSTLKKMVSELLSKLDIHHSFAENEWEAIEKSNDSFTSRNRRGVSQKTSCI